MPGTSTNPETYFIRFTSTWTVTTPITNISLATPQVRPSVHSAHERQEFIREASATPGLEISRGEDEAGTSPRHDKPGSVMPPYRDGTPHAGTSRIQEEFAGSETDPEESDPDQVASNDERRTVPLAAVSERKRRTVRETDIPIFYFSAVGSGIISGPPSLPESSGVQVSDIFVYKSQLGNQAWRCVSLVPQLEWMKLKEKRKYTVKEGCKRYFVITPTGLPSWVQRDTLGRTYKEKNDRSSQAPSLSASKMRGKGKGVARFEHDA